MEESTKKISNAQIKAEIVSALSHPEAEEGLYFRNLYYLDDEDERPQVQGTQEQILESLRELIDEGRITVNDSGPEIIFSLAHEGEVSRS